MKFQGNVELQSGGYITGARVENLSADPMSPFVGQIWYNTTTGVYKGYQTGNSAGGENVNPSIVQFAIGGALGNYALLSGATFTGAVLLDGNSTDNTFVANDSAATQGYVNAHLTAYTNTLTGSASSILTSSITASRAVVTDSSQKIAASTTTAAQVAALGNLNSATKVVVTDSSGIAVTTANATVDELNALATISSTKGVVLATDATTGLVTTTTLTTSQLEQLVGLAHDVAVITDGSGNITTANATTTQINALAALNSASAVVVTDSTGKNVGTANTSVTQLNALAALNSAAKVVVTDGTTGNTVVTANTTVTQLNNLAAITGQNVIVGNNAGGVTSASTTVSQINYLASVTPSVALISDSSGNVIGSTVSTTEVESLHALSPDYVILSSPTAGNGIITSTITTTEVDQLAGIATTDNYGTTTATNVVAATIQDQLNNRLSLAGGTLRGSVGIVSGQVITIADVATAGTDAVNLNTLQSYIANLRYRQEAQARDSVSTTLPTGAVVVDGYTIVNNDRVLFTNLASGNNEIYVATVAGGVVNAWTAAEDLARTSAAPVEGDTLIIENGTVYKEAGYTWNGTQWVQFNGGTQVTAGAGLTKSGNVLSVVYGAGITNLPTGDIGVNVDPAGGLWTEVGGVADQTTASVLAVKVANHTLTTDSTGLYVPANGITATEINTSTIGAGLAGAGGTTITVDTLSTGSIVNNAGSGTQVAVKLNGSTLNSTANGLKVSSSGITATEIAVGALGNGLTGGAGTVVSANVLSTGSIVNNAGSGSNQLAILLDPAGSSLVSTSTGLQVAASGITDREIAAAALGNGLTGGAGTVLSVVPNTGVTVTSSGVGLDLTYADGRYLNTTGDTLTGDLILNTSGPAYTPATALSAASKGYVDAQISDLYTKVNTDVTRFNTRITNGYYVYDTTSAGLNLTATNTYTFSTGFDASCVYPAITVTDGAGNVIIPQSISFSGQSVTVTFNANINPIISAIGIAAAVTAA